MSDPILCGHMRLILMKDNPTEMKPKRYNLTHINDRQQNQSGDDADFVEMSKLLQTKDN